MRDYSRLSRPVKKSSHKLNKRVNSIIKWLLILIFGSLVLLVVVNLLGYNANNITVANYGTISNQFEETALIIRDEQVVFASQPGRIDLNVAEGQRVSAGNLVATINDGQTKDELYNYDSGIISYQVDGLENSLKVEDIKELNYKKITKLKGSIKAVESNEKVNAGRPIFKVINNFKFYLAVLLPQGELQNYENGDQVELAFSKLPTQTLQAKVKKTILDSPQNIMILEVDRFLSGIIGLRKTKVKVIKEQHHGLIVPTTALKEEDDKTTVRVRGYVKDYTTEVKLKGKLDGKAVIKKGLSPGTKVILN
ncbi:MAG: HlyD family efflux transporter periplasmic adaptor subunit [Bacillota bacterium]